MNYVRDTFFARNVIDEPHGFIGQSTAHAEAPNSILNTFSGRIGCSRHADWVATRFGYMLRGTATLVTESGGQFPLFAGMYFSVTGNWHLVPDPLTSAAGFLVDTKGYQGMFQVGGPIERGGRLRYIDGCTDSLLIPPQLKGDPCLNALYFPPGTDQTEHTHPTVRIGIVAAGAGECVTPDGVTPLTPGTVFIIGPEGRHKFRTHDRELVVIAYHPDSDTGPEHDDHPMINRTIVEGVSARHIDAIRTQI